MNKKFNIGLLCALIGAILLITKSMFWFCGLLFTLVAIILILLSKNGWVNKLIWAIVVIIVTFICFMLGFYLRGANAFEEFYFSSKFNGKVRILYSKDCGIVPEKKGDWTIINVDTNHVLIIKRENRRVYTQSKFFLVDENGNKTEIKRITKQSDFKNEISILHDYTGSYKDYDVNIQDFILMRSVRDIPSNEEISRIDSLSLAKLIDCKKEAKK